MRKVLLLILSTVLSLAANAAQPAGEIINQCWQDNAHSAMTSCVIEVAKKAAQDLVLVEKDMMDAIEKSPELQSYKSTVRNQFGKGIAAYRSYRKVHCGLRAALASMGNGTEDNRRSCEAELDMDRAQQLTADLFWLK